MLCRIIPCKLSFGNDLYIFNLKLIWRYFEMLSCCVVFSVFYFFFNAFYYETTLKGGFQAVHASPCFIDEKRWNIRLSVNLQGYNRRHLTERGKMFWSGLDMNAKFLFPLLFEADIEVVNGRVTRVCLFPCIAVATTRRSSTLLH